MTKILPSIPRYCLYTLLIFTPLARASVQAWAITTIHIITLIALTAFLIDKTLTGKFEWIKTSLDKPILALIILCIISTIFSIDRRTSIWSTILLLNYIVIFYLVIHTIRTRSELRHLIYLIIGMATFLSIFGLFKRAGVNPFSWWNYQDIGLYQYLNRVSGTFGNSNSLASYLGMAFLLTLGFLLTGISKGRRFLLICLSCVLLAALVLTLSRGGWIGTSAGILFMGVMLLLNPHFKSKKMVVALAGGFVFVALVVVASTAVVERIRSLEEVEGAANFRARVTVWKGIVDVIEQYPVLGTGPGTFATAFTQFQSAALGTRYFMGHNDYLQLTSEVGLVFIAIVVWMIIALYRGSFMKLHNPSRLVRGATIGAMSGITAVLIHSIVDFNFHIPADAVLFTFLAALALGPVPAHRTSPPASW